MSTGGPIKGNYVTQGSSSLPDNQSESNSTTGDSSQIRFPPSDTDEIPALGHIGTSNSSSAQLADIRLNGNSDIYASVEPVQQNTPVNLSLVGDDNVEPFPTETHNVSELPVLDPTETTWVDPIPMTDRPWEAKERSLLDAIDLEDPETWDFDEALDGPIDGAVVFFTTSTTSEANVVFISDGLAETLGFSAADLLGQPLGSLAGPSSIDDARELLVNVVLDESTGEHSDNGSLRTIDDRELPVSVSYSAIPTLYSEASYVIALYRVDSSQTLDESDSKQHPGLLDSFAHGSSLGSLCYDISEHVKKELGPTSQCWIGISNQATGDRYALEPVVTMGAREGLVKRLLTAMFNTEDKVSARCTLVEDLPADLRKLTSDESIESLWGFPAVGQDGSVNCAIIIALPGTDEPSAGHQKTVREFAALIARTNERQTNHAQLNMANSAALYDQLTRLPNRSLLLDRLEQATARLGRDSSPLAVLMIDIDNFRSINTTYGASLGDEILIEVAARIHNSVRLGDTVGRIGGDQFVLVCVATNGDHDVAGLARRISRSISEPIELDDGTELFLTASIGVVVVDDDQEDPTEIVSKAESAMLTAMQSGRGQFAMFDSELQRNSAESQTLEQALHRAIMNEELLLHYQPVFGLETGQMVGAEALVRWTHPEEGLISPAAFMDLAEESGLIIPMGDWIINKAAEAAASWPEIDGRFPIVTVNLSARQMADTGLVTTIEESLRRFDLPPSRLGFEITESAQINDLDLACETLRRITALGCRVAIDDFGIGHATLDYLRRFSMASAIKIDRSFTSGLATVREDSAIVAASIAMATSLGMQVVAEGVESQDQLRELRRLGCHYAQGFLLSRPVSIEVAQKIWLIDADEEESLPTT